MKKKVVKKKAPKITPKIDPNMPADIVSALLDALKGGKFILITNKGDQISTDCGGISTKVEFLGMLEIAKS